MAITANDALAERFARLPEYTLAKLSPDGRHIAVTLLRDGYRAVAIVDAASFEPTHVERFDPPNEAHDLHWVSDNRLLIVLATRVGALEIPVLTGELFAVNTDGSQTKWVFDGSVERGPTVISSGDPSRGELPRIQAPIRRRVRVASLATGRPNEVLLVTQVPGVSGARRTEALGVDVLTGALRRDIRAPVPAAALLADASGAIRLAMSIDQDDLSQSVFEHVREPRRDSWQPLGRYPFDGPRLLPMGFDAAGGVWWLGDLDDDRTGLLHSPAPGAPARLWHRDARVDVDALLMLGPGQPAYALRLRPDRASYRVLAPDRPDGALFARALQAFVGQDLELTSLQRDGRAAILRVRSDRDAGSYYRITHDAPPELLLRERAWLPPESLAPTHIETITTRDGLPLQIYVTGLDSTPSPAPVVVWPHGGPQGARDDGLFDDTVQLLAAAGYVVVQANYRGSRGYGRAFLRAGDSAWATGMLDDLDDAVAHVLRSGHGDPARVCIGGQSYGAYAALTSVLRFPGRYRCAIGSAGVYDLRLLAETGDLRHSAQGRALLARLVGAMDDATLAAQSPLPRAAALNVPVLLVHGREDLRLPPKHAREMHEALLAAGREVSYLELPNEGHGYVAAASRQRYFAAMLDFLAQHIGSRAHKAANIGGEPE